MNEIYFSHGKTPEWRYQRWDATTTLAIWTPRTGNRLVVTNLHIANSASVATTFVIFMGATNSAPARVFEFVLGASAQISPTFGQIESTAVNYILYGRPASSPSDGIHLTATGFEFSDA